MADWQERDAEEEWDTKSPSRGEKTERKTKEEKEMWELKESLEHLDLQCEMLEEYNPEYLFWNIIWLWLNKNKKMSSQI